MNVRRSRVDELRLDGSRAGSGGDTSPVFAAAGRRAPVIGAVLTVIAGAGTAVAVVHSSPGVQDVVGTAKACGTGWVPPAAGVRAVTFRNEAGSPLDFELEAPDQVTVYQRVEGVGPGTTMTVPITFPAGTFGWTCDGLDGSISRSRTFTVAGRAGGPSHPQVQNRVDLASAAVLQFRETTAARLGTLRSDTDALVAVADRSTPSRSAVQKAWLPAYLDYVRVAGMYDTFGDFDDQIDGRPDGLQGGTANPKWTGFLRLQHELWSGAPMADVARVTDELDHDVRALVADFPNETTQLNDVPIRVHEILENGLQRELTADTDEGSHSNLPTLRAEVDATQTALSAETPTLQTHDPALLRDAGKGLTAVAATLDSLRTKGGGWPALQSLSVQQREQLDGQVGALVERLAAVPAELELDPAALNDS